MPEDQNVGYYDGVLDMYIAFMTQKDTTTAAPAYDDPVLLGMSIEATLTPRYREGRLDASNTVVRRAKRIDGYDVKLNID